VVCKVLSRGSVYGDGFESLSESGIERREPAGGLTWRNSHESCGWTLKRKPKDSGIRKLLTRF
jgi:hypothetical protein